MKHLLKCYDVTLESLPGFEKLLKDFCIVAACSERQGKLTDSAAAAHQIIEMLTAEVRLLLSQYSLCLSDQHWFK
jgi:hypothetical protein